MTKCKTVKELRLCEEDGILEPNAANFSSGCLKQLQWRMWPNC